MAENRERWDATFEGTRRRQMLLGLAMTPLERLRWLERRREEIQRLARSMKRPAGGVDPEGGTGY